MEADDGEGGKRRTNRARRERKGTPQGSPISPLAGNLCMRRLIPGWKTLGHARRLRAEIVNDADDLCVLGKAPAAEMLATVGRLVTGLKLTVNEGKTRCLCGVRRKRSSSWDTVSGAMTDPTGRAPVSAPGPPGRASRAFAAGSAWVTAQGWSRQPPAAKVEGLNRVLTGWANCFSLGQVSPACSAIERHAVRRLRRWLCRQHKVKTGNDVRLPDTRLHDEYGLPRLSPGTRGLVHAKA